MEVWKKLNNNTAAYAGNKTDKPPKWFDAIIPHTCKTSHLTEVNSTDAVSNSVQGRRPTHHAHDVWDHQQYRTGHPRFGRQTHLGDDIFGICFTKRTPILSLRLSCVKEKAHPLPSFTHMKCHLTREVVHAAWVHETQSVSHRFGTQDTLACDWTDPSVGQSGGHDASWFAGHLDGAELRAKRDYESCIRL